MLTMSTPALNFVAVCGNANLPLNGTKATYLKALKGPGVALGPSLTPADLKERFGALTWVRHTVANAIDPLTWPVMLGAPLLAVLRSLYSIPPQRPDAPAGETDLHRLAHMVSLFLPDGLSTASAALPLLRRRPRVEASIRRVRRLLLQPRRPHLRRLQRHPGWPATDPSGRHPVLLSVAHPRSPTSSTVAEPGPTPGRPGRPPYPPLAAAAPAPRFPTPADEDPAPCPLSA